LAATNYGAIYLVDTGKAVLGAMSHKAQTYAFQSLKQMGVKIKLGVGVRDFANDAVRLSDETIISTMNLIWTAGVTARKFEGITEETYGRGRRMQVDKFNKIIGTKNIFAIGDTCILTSDAAFPNGHPQMAQVAIQQGRNLANNLVRSAIPGAS